MKTHTTNDQKKSSEPGAMRGNRKRFISLAVAAVLVVAGAGSVIFGLTHQLQPPQPPAMSDSQTAAHGTMPEASKFSGVLSYSVPTTLTIPSIGVDAQLIQVGKNSDGSIQVPAAPDFDKPAWYKYSPAPGQPGAAIIEGHVDNYKTGASVFYNLGKLKPGDQIKVGRSDGKTAVFNVNDTHNYAKDMFPTRMVYESSGSKAELRLITCSGEFNRSTGHYEDNIVVYATLTNSP